MGAAISVVLLYGKPVLQMPASFLSPMQRFMSMPHGSAFSQYGAIAVIPWMLLCDRASNMLLQAVLPPGRAALPVPAKGLATSRSDAALSEGAQGHQKAL